MENLLWCALLISAVASAQTPSRQQMAAEAIRDYGSVIGGVALNDRCKFLDETQTSAYQSDVTTITPVLSQDIGDPRLMNSAIDAALSEAASDKYAGCDDSARQIVAAASTHAKNWAEQIRRIQGSGKQE